MKRGGSGPHDLRGPVAVIDGDLYPLRSFSVSQETNTQDVFNRLGTQSQTVVTSQEFSGTIESYRSFELPHLGAPDKMDMYLFPQEGGTRERVIVRDAIVSGTSSNTNAATQTIDFVALEVEE